MALKGGGVAGSLKALKSAVKRGSGGSGIDNIPADGERDVRFLSEPTDWFAYEEHYDETLKFFPCDDTNCPGCDDGMYASKKWLAPYLDVGDGNRQGVIKLAKTLVEQVLRAYQKYGTVLGNDFNLTREGTGKETTYGAIPMAPSKINLNKYKVPSGVDLEKMLLGQLIDDDDEDDDDDDELSAAVVRRSAAASKRAPVRTRKPAPVDEDEEDDEPPARRPIRKPGAARAEKEAPARRPIRKGTTATTTTRKPIRRK